MNKKPMSMGVKILLATLFVLTFPISVLVWIVYMLMDD